MILGLGENTIIEDVPVFLGGKTDGKTGLEGLAEECGTEGAVEVEVGDLLVQASQVSGVEGAGRRVVAGSVPVFQEVVRPEDVYQAGSHDGTTEALLLFETVTMVVHFEESRLRRKLDQPRRPWATNVSWSNSDNTAQYSTIQYSEYSTDGVVAVQFFASSSGAHFHNIQTVPVSSTRILVRTRGRRVPGTGTWLSAYGS
jgi:hypothetical protein